MTELTPEALTERRERVFIALAAVFLSAMTLLNVVGITKSIYEISGNDGLIIGGSAPLR